MEFYVECYPNEIAEKLCNLAMENPDEKTVAECSDALYNLKAIAENSYNSDCYKVLYQVLEKIMNRD